MHDGATARSHSSTNPVAATLQLLRSEAIDLRAVAIYSAAAGLLSLAVPVAVQALVNQVAFTAMQQPLVVLSLVVLVALALQGVLAVLQVSVVERIQRRLMMRAATTLAQRLQGAQQEALLRESGPDLANRFFDVVTLQKSAATLLLDGIAVALQLGLGLTLLALYHPSLLGFAAILTLLLLLVLFVLGRGTVATAIDESKAKYAVAAWLENLAAHRLLFTSTHGKLFAQAQLDGLTRHYLHRRGHHFSVLMRQVIGLKTLYALAGAGLLAAGGALVLQRQLTLGQLVAAELMLSAVLQSVAKLGKQLESWYDLVAAVDKLEHVADLPQEPDGREHVPGDGPLAVELRGVEVRRGQRAVLQGASARWSAGARVAVLGTSGGGKSTIAQLLQGVCRVAAGQVVLGGVETRALSLASLRAAVAVVRPDDAFDGTLFDNVAVGHPGVGPAEVRSALDRVGLLDAVQLLPEGLDTRLHGRGAPLSAGQVRLLMLARALAAQPRLLVLDEVLDALSVADRARIWRAVAGESAAWTLLVLTWQPEVAALCDQTWTLDDGQLRGGPAQEAA